MAAAAPDGTVGYVEVPDDAPRLGTAEARLRSVRVTALDGAPIGSIYLDQRFRVTAEFEVLADLDDAVFEIGVSTYAGERVVTANSVDREQPAVRVERGRRAISVELAPALLPGEFTFDVGVHHGNGTTIDYVQGLLRLSALNAAEQGGDHYPWNAVRGYVRPDAVWSDVTDATSAPVAAQPGG
jgi:hypothetical protein